LATEKQLKSIMEDFGSPTFQTNAPRDLPKWKAFVASVTEQQAVAKGLLGTDGGLGVCGIALAGSSAATRNDDEWQETWRELKLISESASTGTRTGHDADEKIGDAPLQQKLELRLIRNGNDPASPTFPAVVTGDWGPLELIHKFKGERDKDHKTWLVKFPVGAPGAKGLIRLKLKFENELPELDKWPAP
jgi:hypothetical protein